MACGCSLMSRAPAWCLTGQHAGEPHAIAPAWRSGLRSLNLQACLFEPGDCAQVIYLDHRGNGRSDAGPKEAWTLAQWGDDVRAFCDALGIEHPIVLGAS